MTEEKSPEQALRDMLLEDRKIWRERMRQLEQAQAVTDNAFPEGADVPDEGAE